MGKAGILRFAWFGLGLWLLSAAALQGTYADIPSFSDLPQQIVEFSNTNGAKLPCKTAQPDTQINWLFKDGTHVTNVKDLRIVDDEGNLIFPPFSAESFRQDVHATVYKCTATNALGTVTTPEVKVKAVVLQPYDVYVYDVYAMQGNTAVFRCHVPSFLSRYVNVTAWIRDSVVVIKSTQIDQSTDSKYSLMPSGELFVKEVDMKDAMTSFQCQTYNRLNGATVKSSTSGKLFVAEPQGTISPKIIFSMKKITVQRGQFAFLPCEVQANPPANTRWHKLGKDDVLKNGLNRRYNRVFGSLIIKNVASSDNGTYRCVASNSAGEDSIEIDLLVIDIPSVAMEFASVIADVGKSISFSCKPSTPQPSDLMWYKNGKPIIFNQKISLNNENSSIQINSVTDDSKGVYQCCVKNEIKTSCGSTALVLGDIPPSIIERFDSTIKNPSDNLKLKCVATGNPLPEITWFLDNIAVASFDNVNVEEVIGNNNVVSELTIHNLRLENGGLYACTAENQAGKVFHWSRININGKLGMRAQPPLNAVNGEIAVLNCPVYGYPIVDVKWEKDGVLLPKEIRQIQPANNSLVINNVLRTRDTGIYTCIVKGSSNHEIKGTIQLNVLVAPKLIPFSFQDELVQEGSRGRLQCVVVEGDEPLEMQWLKDGRPIPTDLGVTIRAIDEFSSILMISAITPRHNGKYTCQARNAAGIASFSTNLAVNVAPKITPFNFPDNGVTEGVLARVSCVVYQGDLPIQISWLRNGKVLSSDTSIATKSIDDYSSILTIENVQRHHAGNYTCVAHNSAATVSHSTSLLVNVPPKWILKPESQTVENGNDAYFHCKAEGYPVPSITWMFATDVKAPTRHELRSDAETQILKNGTLILRDISKNKEGGYICIASNGVGVSLSAIVLLNVLSPPHFEQKEQTLNGKLGEKLELVCMPNGDTPITISWNDDKKTMSLGSKYQENKKNSTSTLIIHKLTRDDSKKITCTAENKFGSDKVDFFINVQEPPEAPILNEAVGSNRSIFLTWSKPFDGNSQITKYTIQYKKLNDNWQLTTLNQTVDSTKAALHITNLQPATSYTFRVIATNAVGDSKMSNEVTQTTEIDVPTGVVQNVEVESVDGNTLRITWTAPRKDTWNGPIRGYNIGYRVAETKDAYEFSALEVPEDYTEDLIYQITNLRKYTVYSVVIQVYNDKGVGPLSEPIDVMTSEDVPSVAPEGLRCSALSSKSVYVLWDPIPVDNANGILRGYKVFYKSISEWYNVQSQYKSSEKEKVTLQNLEVNTNYSITVVGFTKVGDGVKSEPVFCKTHEDVPDRPNEIKVLPASSDSVVIAWKPPKRINGNLLKYNVYYRTLSESEEMGTEKLLKTEQSKTNNVHAFQSDSEYLEVKGLRKNQKYAFWVSATSAIGEGQHSDVIAQTVAESSVPATAASFDDVIHTPWKRDITLPCRAVGIPPPQRKWTLGNAMLPIAGRKVLLSDGTLLINKVDNDDSGNYTCTIYNSHGKDQVHYNLNVQVPPSSPILDIISKTRSSIQLKWKPGPDGGDSVKGYTLHYRKDGGEWETMELSTDKEIITLNNLACGANYQIFMEAFNKVGKGLPCDTIRTSTEGSEVTIPTKDQLLHEGSTFVSVHLESWPVTSCPVKNFQVEYRPLHADEWITVSSSIRPTQKKLVIPGLSPATWYALRVTGLTNGDAVPAEYTFSTRTINGGTIPPPEIKISKPQSPVYIFYLDPYIFIPSVALLIVVIITSVVVCLWLKRKGGSVGTPSDYASTLDNTYGKGSSYATSTLYATIPHNKNKSRDPNPYATGRVDYFPDSDNWVETRTLTRAMPHHSTIQGVRVLPQRVGETMQKYPNRPGLQETAFMFGNSESNQTSDGYDKPPKGM